MHILFAGGGTGGHVFVGLAIAEKLQTLTPEHKSYFVGTKLGLEVKLVPEYGHTLYTLPVAPIKGKSLRQKISALIKLPAAVLGAFKLIRRLKIDVVVGVGGYASAPALIAAKFAGIPSILCEQNSIPGFTNQRLAFLAKRVCGSFEMAAPYFSKNKYVLTGNPIRKAIEHTHWARHHAAPPFHIVIIGGSRGAHALNVEVPKALHELHKSGLLFRISHQCGTHDEALVRASYEKFGLDAEVKSFFDDMHNYFKNADLLIARAGATTCAEVLHLGLPVVFIPYPYAIYDHQSFNAQALASEGLAKVISEKSLTTHDLAKTIRSQLENRDAIHDAFLQKHPEQRHNAAEAICNEIFKLVD